jgi:hypothetical protein
MKVFIKDFIILIISAALMAGCKKENTDFINDDTFVIDTLSYTGDFISIEKVVSVSLMTATLKNYKIDLNADSIFDVELSADVWHPIWGFFWNSSIKTLSDSLEIDIITKTELYANYSNSYFNSSTNETITINYYENYNSNKTYPSNLKIDTTFGYYPEIHSQGDTLNQSNNWKSGSFILEYDSNAEGFTMSSVHNGIWEGINNKFIGIRFSKGDKQYYGWIELSVNSYEISLNRYFLRMK